MNIVQKENKTLVLNWREYIIKYIKMINDSVQYSCKYERSTQTIKIYILSLMMNHIIFIITNIVSFQISKM